MPAVRRVVIAGASGLIGRALSGAFRRKGIEVRRLVRRSPAGAEELTWDPAAGTLDGRALDGVDGVLNLAGRGIGSGRWTRRARAEVVESRVRSTRLLVDAMRTRSVRPSVLVSASAIGYYGDRGDEILTEASPAGDGFLADLVRDWEAEALRASALGVRVVCTRFGLILARDGGAMGPLLPLFRLGLGGPLGSGRQWWSWVHLDDVIAAVIASITTPAFEGPVNVVGPRPVSNRDFARALGAALHRPAILPAPALALRLVLGAMADEMILSSQRVVPTRLQAQGFVFRWPELGPALANLV